MKDYKFSIRSVQGMRFLCDVSDWMDFPWVDSDSRYPNVRGFVFKSELIKELLK